MGKNLRKNKSAYIIKLTKYSQTEVQNEQERKRREGKETQEG